MVKNEARSIEQVIKSAAAAVDRVDLLDTGSSDETLSIAQATCAQIGIPCALNQASFVDFSTSRNQSLSFAEPHAEFAIQLSGDETLTGGAELRNFCEIARSSMHGAFYVWVEAGQQLLRSARLVRLGSGWRWERPVHEYMVHPEGQQVELTISADLVRILHQESDSHRKRLRFYRDLEVLHQEHERAPNDARTQFYLAQTFECLGFFAQAAHFYLRRGANQTGWDEEQYLARHRGALCILQAGLDDREAERILLDAAALRPWRAETWVVLAERALQNHRLETAYMFAKKASELPVPLGDGLGIEPSAYEWRADHVISFAAGSVGAFQEGIRASLQMIERNPEEQAFKKNLEFYRSQLGQTA